MMITVYDVNNFGKQASEDYVQNDVSLNESIVKLASTNGLTRNQIDRVVEAANNETYLSLLKTAKDKYVEFPLANTKEVFSEIHKEASVLSSNVSDYDSPPRSKSEELAESEIFGDLTKVASEDKERIEKIRGAEALKMASQIKGTHTFLNNAADDTAVEFAKTYDQLTHLVKQAVLNGVSFNDIGHINEAAMPILHSEITTELKASLALDMPRFDFEKEAKYEYPNPGSALFQTGAELEKLASKYININYAVEHYEAQHSELQELTNEKLVPLQKKAGKEKPAKEAIKLLNLKAIYHNPDKYIKRPLVYGTLAGGGYQVGKNKGITEQNQVLKEQFLDPKLYKRY
jgi:hypothetical protein